jgi:hypothetical protein
LMKRLVVLSLVLLVTLSTGVLSISCTCEEEAAETTTPPQIPAEGFYLNPTSIELQPGQTLSINVEVKSSRWGASGGEINLAFNPAVLQVVDIETGDFFGSSPIVGLKRVDNQGGIVRLALARVGETAVPSPPGVLATVEFRVLDSAASGSYEIELTSVGLADENFQDITGFNIQGATIKISP